MDLEDLEGGSGFEFGISIGAPEEMSIRVAARPLCITNAYLNVQIIIEIIDDSL